MELKITQRGQHTFINNQVLKLYPCLDTKTLSSDDF